MKKILLIGFIIFCIFQMLVMATAIDIGITASDRGGYVLTQTYVNVGNPANESGTITSVEIYAVTNYDLIDCEVATFYVVSGNNLSTRDTVALSTVTAGSKQTITTDINSDPIALTVVTGDYIGIYFSSGRLERDTTGEAGLWRLAGDQIPCTDATFALYSTRGFSLYGTGATAAAGFTWNAQTISTWNGKTISTWNGM